MQIYPPSEDSYFFIDVLQKEMEVIKKQKVIAEVGFGSGILTEFLSAKIKSAVFLVTDINLNALNNKDRINRIHTNLFCGIKNIDMVFFNPPYVPTNNEEKNELIKSYAGYKNGNEIIIQFINKINESEIKLVYLLCTRLNNVNFVMSLFTKHRTFIVDRRKILGETLYIIKGVLY